MEVGGDVLRSGMLSTIVLGLISLPSLFKLSNHASAFCKLCCNGSSGNLGGLAEAFLTISTSWVSSVGSMTESWRVVSSCAAVSFGAVVCCWTVVSSCGMVSSCIGGVVYSFDRGVSADVVEATLTIVTFGTLGPWAVSPCGSLGGISISFEIRDSCIGFVGDSVIVSVW